MAEYKTWLVFWICLYRKYESNTFGMNLTLPSICITTSRTIFSDMTKNGSWLNPMSY